MIIRFSIENWMSFRDKTEFSMIASHERQHGERLTKLDKYKTNILPTAAIFGGNASGKTNFFKALNFAKNLIVNGTPLKGSIKVEPFILDSKNAEKPTKFHFELLINDTVYEYSFSITSKLVLDERLVKITPKNEIIHFSRRGQEVDINASLPDFEHLEFAFKGTRPNQLFLTNSISQQISSFENIYDFFDTQLVLIAPDWRFTPFEEFWSEDNPLYNKMNEVLPLLDTGIDKVCLREVSMEEFPFPEQIRLDLFERLENGHSVKIIDDSHFYIVAKSDDKITLRKLITYHRKADGSKAQFELAQESDGTKRIIDLLPAFLELSSGNSNIIFIVDEIERSLHTVITKLFIDLYLKNRINSDRSQLLFTTHDLELMDQSMFRRDETWVVERDYEGASRLTSLSEYKDVRSDKDIRKSYKHGRFGGIPKLPNLEPGPYTSLEKH